MSAFSSFFFTSVLIIVLILQIISFTRGPFLFVFNFNPDASYQLYSVGVDEAGEYQVTNAVCMNLFFCKYASGRHI